MSEKNNIDRLFQEKFKDFDVAPPERLWQNIEAELQKKKKRRVIPIWFRVGGVAAILVIGLMFTIPFFGNFDGNNANPVVIDNNTGNGPSKLQPTNFPIKPNTTVTDADSTSRRTGNDVNTAVASGNEDNKGSKSEVNSPTSSVTQDSDNKAVRNSNNAVAYDNNQDNTPASNRNTTSTASKRVGNKINHTNRNSAVAHQSNVNEGGSKRNATSNGNRGIATDNNSGSLSNADKTAVAANVRNTTDRQNQTNAVSNKTSAEAEGNANQSKNTTAIAYNSTAGQRGNTTGNEQDSKGTQVNNAAITGATAETAIAATVVDTAAVTKPVNELEKLLQEKLNGKDSEEKAVAEVDKNKWNIKPQLAPVFYNSLSEGSPIDPQFAGNNKEYSNDLSYGIGVNYAVSSKITLRTGVNTVNLSYATNDVQFFAALNQQTPNIAARGNANIVVVSNTGPAITNVDGLPTPTVDGSLVQKTGYIEVPFEMSYKVLDKKFGIDVIGGVSTLFLNENNVHVRTLQGYTSNIGEAQNLNNVHFSTNIGLGFRYSFWKAFQANFEPMFKYQVNTFSGDAGNFKPYFIGLYSGISFSF